MRRTKMINNSADYWSEQIVVYCGENKISLREFAKRANLHHNTVLNIVHCNVDKVMATTAGILFNVIFRNRY